MMYEKLKEVLSKRGITVYRLSKMTKIGTADLYSALGGKRPLYEGWRKRIAKALNVSECAVFGVDYEELNKLDEEIVFYDGRLYVVDEHDEEYLYLIPYWLVDGKITLNLLDEVSVPIDEYKKLLLVNLDG